MITACNKAILFLCCAAFAVRPMAAAGGDAPSATGFVNPILFSDYSDPDVIRDGDSYYLVASTFHFSPGIPILQSPDLVHWRIIGHVVKRLAMSPRYDLSGMSGYGSGIWAPAIRKHGGKFYVYFPTPSEGIFVSTTDEITGPWTEAAAVIAQGGLEDPCPFWDDDGNAYLVHSKKGAGPLILHQMSPDGLKVLDEGREIVRDPANLPTLEGPKLYKRNGYYYIFAPFGGVSKGSQAVLRSRSIHGPYEHRTVLARGSTAINGPHQGGYVETPDGKGWFIHFQSRGAHGRIVHLEPVRWEDDWPVMGEAAPGAETGAPVAGGPLPVKPARLSTQRPQTSDEFSGAELGPQWEWNHNPDDAHWSLTKRSGFLRLEPTRAEDFLLAHNTLTQQMQDERFEMIARLDVDGLKDGTHAGLAMFEREASGLEVVQEKGARTLRYFHVKNVVAGPVLTAKVVELRLRVDGEAVQFAYRADDTGGFTDFGPSTKITFSWWKGSRPALFAYSQGTPAEDAHADFDWVHCTPAPKP